MKDQLMLIYKLLSPGILHLMPFRREDRDRCLIRYNYADIFPVPE